MLNVSKYSNERSKMKPYCSYKNKEEKNTRITAEHFYCGIFMHSVDKKSIKL